MTRDRDPVLMAGQLSEPARFLSREACRDLVARIRASSTPEGYTDIAIYSQWAGDARWARNRTTLASDRQENVIEVARRFEGSEVRGKATTNQTDAASLQAMVRWAEQIWYYSGGGKRVAGQPDDIPSPSELTYLPTPIWNEATYAQTPEMRNAIVGTLVASAERAGMLSAGYVSVQARATSYAQSSGDILYAPQTIAQCSLTVRDPEGSGSGWAGASAYDWNRFDPAALAEIAIDKCLRSRNPVRIEPGRYTTILEPQATFNLMSLLVSMLGRIDAEVRPSSSPFHDRDEDMAINPYGPPAQLTFSKLGQRVLDERITISHDPMNPAVGVVPFDPVGDAYRPVTWIDKGVLVTLAHSTDYAHAKLHLTDGAPNSGAFQMSGGTTTLEEMIATTKRGVVVTRLSGLRFVSAGGNSPLWSGVTRDGFWLVENGKITHPIKNFRFTESPLFAFNNVEQLGVPVPVFSPEYPAVVPPVKILDFSFTSLVDAV